MPLIPPVENAVQAQLNALESMIDRLETLQEELGEISVDDNPVNDDFAALVNDILTASGAATDTLLAMRQQCQNVAADEFFPPQG